MYHSKYYIKREKIELKINHHFVVMLQLCVEVVFIDVTLLTGSRVPHPNRRQEDCLEMATSSGAKQDLF